MMEVEGGKIFPFDDNIFKPTCDDRTRLKYINIKEINSRYTMKFNTKIEFKKNIPSTSDDFITLLV